MASLLVRNARLVATMDDDNREIPDADIYIVDGIIAAVGQRLEVNADETFDASDSVVIPGFVNSHHHIFQTLYRAIPEVQQTDFLGWIGHLGALWMRNPPSPEAVYSAAQVSFGELLITGTTTTADQHYLFLNKEADEIIGRTVDAAREAGIRFHPARGCCTMGRSRGGYVDDALTQPEDVVLRHAEEIIQRYHDPADNATVRVNLAPVGIYSDTEYIFRAFSQLADQHPGIGLHTHLHEGGDYELSKRLYGVRPLDFLERVGWTGDRVVLYHMSDPAPDASEIAQIARLGVHVSHCCGSDLALSYGLPPIRHLADAGAHVCLGTTGCASNLGGHILIEARLAFAVHRLASKDPRQWLSPREVLRQATRGGADALGRRDLGRIAPGKGGDLAIFDMNRLDRVGQHDPVTALVTTGASHLTKATVVNGRIVARNGELQLVDGERIVREAERWARRLVA